MALLSCHTFLNFSTTPHRDCFRGQLLCSQLTGFVSCLNLLSVTGALLLSDAIVALENICALTHCAGSLHMNALTTCLMSRFCKLRQVTSVPIAWTRSFWKDTEATLACWGRRDSSPGRCPHLWGPRGILTDLKGVRQLVEKGQSARLNPDTRGTRGFFEGSRNGGVEVSIDELTGNQETSRSFPLLLLLTCRVIAS